MTATLAPIVLFVFARPEHTRRTLEALAANALAKVSDLIVYADAARNESEVERVQAVRAQVHEAAGFQSVTVIERETNFGLARNIIEGVTEVCNRFGRVIVVEDDIVTSPRFLSFMNAALDQYVNVSRVWHISGWNYPIDPSGLDAAFFWRVMNCWGWATWVDRWKYFQKDPRRLIESWDEERIRTFNLDGAHDFWGQITANQKGKLNTWAIFWYATIFERGGLCLNPGHSFVRNIGHDGSGENCGGSDPFAADVLGEEIEELPECNEESDLAVQKIKAFYAELQTPFTLRALFNIARAATSRVKRMVLD